MVKRSWLTSALLFVLLLPMLAVAQQGPRGFTGPRGPAGPQGPAGNAGGIVNWRGVWSNATAYSLNDAASYNGSSYVAIASSTGVTPPSDTTKWMVLANSVTGATGANGTAATITVGTTTNGSPGSAASVTNVGTANAAIFNFIIPQGLQGPQGVQGPTGATGATGPAGPDTTINSQVGPFTFTGSGVTQSGQTFTFNGGGGSFPTATAPGQSVYSSAAGSTSYVAGNPPGSTFYSASRIIEFGDSITYGIGVSNPADGYGNLMIADFGGNGTNYAVSGAASQDISDIMLANYNPTYSHNPAATLMAGSNDLGGFGDNPQLYTPIMAGMMEWATIPRVAKVFFTDSQCTSTGTWANVTTSGFPGGVEQSTTPASTYTCTITTTGPALYFGFMQNMAWTASSMSILIDGAAPSTNPTVSGGPMFYAFQQQYTFNTVRYPLAAGTHTFQVTFAGTSGTTGTIAPVWLGSAYPISTVSPPRLYVSDIPYEQNNSSGTEVADYNSALQTVITQLQGDGLPIVHVQENQPSTGFIGGGPNGAGWLNYSSDFNAATLQGVTCLTSTSPGFHPNNCGHLHLRDAFEYYIQPTMLPASSVSLSANNAWTGTNSWSVQQTFNSGMYVAGNSAGSAINTLAAIMFDAVNPNDYAAGGIMSANPFSYILGLQTTSNRNPGNANTIPFKASTFTAVTSVITPTITVSGLGASLPVCTTSGSVLTTASCNIATLGGTQTFSGPTTFTGGVNFTAGSIGINAIGFYINGTTLVAISGGASLQMAPTATATSSSNYTSTMLDKQAAYWTGTIADRGGFYQIATPATGNNPLITMSHTFVVNDCTGCSGGTATGQESFAYNVNFSSINGVVPIAPIQLTMPTSSITSGQCTSYTSTTMTGLAATSTVTFQNTTDDTGVVGWDPTVASLSIDKYPTANTLHWRVCNSTGALVTPGAMTMNVSAK